MENISMIDFQDFFLIQMERSNLEALLRTAQTTLVISDHIHTGRMGGYLINLIQYFQLCELPRTTRYYWYSNG